MSSGSTSSQPSATSRWVSPFRTCSTRGSKARPSSCSSSGSCRRLSSSPMRSSATDAAVPVLDRDVRDRRLGARWTHRPADRRRRLLQQARVCLGRRMGGLRLLSWRILTKAYFRATIVPADPTWVWMGRWLPETALLALYRASFFYGTTRWTAWLIWAHVVNRLPVRAELVRSRLGRRRLRLR